MSKNKAKTQTYSTGGLYGTSTTGKRGTSYDPSDFETQLVNQTTSSIPAYLQQLTNPSYDSEIFQSKLKRFNDVANQNFENNVINNMANRGLARGSTVNQIAGQYNNSLLNAQQDLFNSEDSRVANVLNQLMNYYQVPYSMMTGINNGSQGLYQNAQQNANNNDLWAGLANAAATAAGSSFGGPAGGAAAAAATNQVMK